MKLSQVVRTVLLLGTALLLVACQKSKGPMEKLGKKADDSARRAADSAQDAAETAGEKIEQAAENLEQSASR